MKTLIAEDEPLAREGLADWVRATPGLELVGCVGDGESALQAARAQRPDLILMDIQMPGLKGLQVLRALGQDEAPLPSVIFTTAYDEHALAAFELHAVDYLLKPFERDRFDEAIAHVRTVKPVAALEALAQAEPSEGPAGPLTRLLVRDLGSIVPLHVDRIEHLRADHKYTAIAAGGRTYLVRLSINHFAQRLDPQRFLKVNRSCIVNLDFVVAMTADDASQLVIQLQDGQRFTASREVSKTLRAQSL
jgi:two-component system, LytTR family, response regulator